MTDPIRQLALEGNWLPKAHERYQAVFKREIGVWRKYDFADNGGMAARQTDTLAPEREWYFFPSQALAHEFQEIMKGTWLPKRGDNIFGIFPEGQTLEARDIDYDFEEARRYGQLYFPSRQIADLYFADRGVKPVLELDFTPARAEDLPPIPAEEIEDFLHECEIKILVEDSLHG